MISRTMREAMTHPPPGHPLSARAARVKRCRHRPSSPPPAPPPRQSKRRSEAKSPSNAMTCSAAGRRRSAAAISPGARPTRDPPLISWLQASPTSAASPGVASPGTASPGRPAHPPPPPAPAPHSPPSHPPPSPPPSRFSPCPGLCQNSTPPLRTDDPAAATARAAILHAPGFHLCSVSSTYVVLRCRDSRATSPPRALARAPAGCPTSKLVTACLLDCVSLFLQHFLSHEHLYRIL